MEISQSFENSKDVGELKPGWSINLFATPHIIGELAGGTGNVSSQLSARDDSLFTINDNVTTTYNDGFYDKFISGTVKSVSQTGNDVSISHSTQLDKYDADYNIPPLTAGGTHPVGDIASLLTGDSGLSSQYFGYTYPGHATSLCGHSNFFDMNHNRIIGESKTTSYTYYNPSTGKYDTVSVDYLRNSVWADNYIQAENSYIYADGVTGDSFSSVYSEANVEHIAYKFILQDELDEFGVPTGNMLGHSWGFSGNPINNNFDYGFECSIVVSPNTNQIIVGFDLTEGGTPVEYKQTIDAVLSLSSEYILYARFAYGKDADGSSRTRFYLNGYITDSFQYVNAAFNETISLYTAPTWYASWGINGLARSLWRYSEFVEMPEPLIIGTKYNYIQNNDFEVDTSGWSVTAGFGATGYVLTRVANTGNFPHGSWSAQTTATAASSGSWYQLAYNIKNLSRASEISDDLQIFSFYAKNTNSINPSTVEVIFYDNFGNPLNSSVWELSDTWDRYSLSFNADSSVTELFLEINIYATDAGSYGMVFDAVQLENYSLQLDLGLTDFWNASMGTYGNTSRQFITRNGQTYSKEVYLANPLDTSQFSEIGYGYYYKDYYFGNPPYALLEPVPGVKMNLWEYLQNAAAAYYCQVTFGTNGFQLESIPGSGDNLKNFIQAPSITPVSSFSGRSVDIVYNNSQVVNGTEVYDAYDDGNKIISVKSKETVNVTINTNSSLNTVLQPKRKFSLPNAEGYFIVSDSTGVPVGGTNTNTAWEDYGGKVSVAINPDIPGAIDVTVTGPFQEIPAYPGPYKLAYSDGSNDYAALSILGNGVKVENKTLNLQTGAVRAKTKQEVAKTITNPFISTLEQAYDRGIWASSEASGPKVSLSASVKSINGTYSNVVGTLYGHEYSSYRIMSLSKSVISDSVNAQKCVYINDFSTKWNGKTVSYHDGVWGTNKIQDENIEPFKKLDIISGYMTDIYLYTNDLYFTADGIVLVIDGSTPGSLVLKFDTDGTPYYSNLNMTDEPTLIYLDTDFTPYYV